MKFKNKIVTYLYILCTILSEQKLHGVLTISQYKPDSTFQTASIPQDYYSNFSTIFSAGFASQSFNETGEKVPFFQQFGTEDLLARFVDASLPNDSTESYGQGLISGDFRAQELVLNFYKSIKNGFFIEAGTAIQDLTIHSISINYIESDLPLSPEQITYLEELKIKLPKILNRSGMFTTAVFAGYNKTFSDFNHLDFIDLTFKAGFLSPQAMLEKNTKFLQFPFDNNINFGYPITAVISVGVFDWITVGINSSMVPWQPAQANMHINNTTSANKVLLPEMTPALLHKGTLFTNSIYFEADHVYQGFSSLIAYCYTASLNSSITPINETNFQYDQANASSKLDAWNLGSFYIQFDLDFAREVNPSAPIIRVFFDIPITGKLCPKTNLIGTSCNLQVSYAF